MQVHLFLSAGLDSIPTSRIQNFLGPGHTVQYADIQIKKRINKLKGENCLDITLEQYFECVTDWVEKTAKKTCWNVYHVSMLGNHSNARWNR